MNDQAGQCAISTRRSKSGAPTFRIQPQTSSSYSVGLLSAINFFTRSTNASTGTDPSAFSWPRTRRGCGSIARRCWGKSAAR